MNRLLNAREIAEILDVPVSWVYQRTSIGSSAIPFIKFGKYVRFDADEVVEFFKTKDSV